LYFSKSGQREDEKSMNTFEALESNVRSYCRSFPVAFNKAKNDVLYTEAGEGYIDFFAGAGA
jgi:diaminobutyrate-2-oxoglutarate transaminase